MIALFCIILIYDIVPTLCQGPSILNPIPPWRKFELRRHLVLWRRRQLIKPCSLGGSYWFYLTELESDVDERPLLNFIFMFLLCHSILLFLQLINGSARWIGVSRIHRSSF